MNSSDALGAGLGRLLTIPTELAALRQELARVNEQLSEISERLPSSLVSVRDAAERLGVSTKTIRRMVAAGEIRSARIGHAVRVDLASAPAAHDAASIARLAVRRR